MKMMNTNLIEEALRFEFNCCKCEELLTSPIMLIATMGNLCSECYSEEYIKKNKVTHKEGYDLVVMHEDEDNMKPPQPSIRNTALEDIMKSVKSRCINNKEGCPFVGDLVVLPTHESLCEYRKINCVLDECKWNGSKCVYIDHLLQIAHESKVSCQPEDPTLFTLDCISPEKETEEIVLLRTISGVCLFHFKTYANANHGMKCAISRIEKESEEEFFHVEFVLKNGNIMSYKCCIIDQIEMFQNFYENEKCEIDFNMNAADPSNKGFSVRLKHNIVGQLIWGLSPQNRISIREDTKKLRGFIRVECDNVANGCYISPLVQEEHSHSCKYQFWNCPCHNYFGICNAEDHFRNIHKYKVDKWYELNSNIIVNHINYINVFNCIFKVYSNCLSNGVEFCVEILGLVRNKKFCFEIILTNSRSTLIIRTPLSPSGPTKCNIDNHFLKKLFGSMNCLSFREKITPM